MERYALQYFGIAVAACAGIILPEVAHAALGVTKVDTALNWIMRAGQAAGGLYATHGLFKVGAGVNSHNSDVIKGVVYSLAGGVIMAGSSTLFGYTGMQAAAILF